MFNAFIIGICIPKIRSVPLAIVVINFTGGMWLEIAKINTVEIDALIKNSVYDNPYALLLIEHFPFIIGKIKNRSPNIDK